MNKTELLSAIKEMIVSGKYTDIEDVLKMVPKELMDLVLEMMESHVQSESEKIERERYR